MTDDESRRAAMVAVAGIAEAALADGAKARHAPLAEASHVAALAAARIEQAGEAGLTRDDLADLTAMLREIQNAGHVAFLRAQGSEVDYQKIGSKVRSRFQTPGGKWRKIRP